MLTRDFAARFAHDWIEAWNAHDLERVLSHYADEFEMTSPLLANLMGVPSGLLQGKEKVGAYWTRALERRPALQFRLKKVTFGLNSLAIHFEAETGRHSTDWFFFGEDGQVTKSFAHHDEITLAD